MLGKVVLEEAYECPDMEELSSFRADLYVAPKNRSRYMRQISDIHDERLDLSNSYGIGYSVLSLTAPGIQGITEKSEAERLATQTNNWIAKQIEGHRDRLGAFACLSMHDPIQAASELRRCVQDLGFHGALLCNFQHAGPDGETYLFYDQVAYDIFWKTLTDLDVPLYIHPSAPTGIVFQKLYAQRPFLVGPPLSFANDVSLHVLGLISNGVFDRFPRVKVIIGHQGEHIPFDLWRINHWFEDIKKPIARDEGRVLAKRTIYDYFRENIWVTTSGHFSTATLKYVANEIGFDRILFSVDYPYETIEDGCGWWDNDKDSIVEAVGGISNYLAIGRENAKKLLKLRDFYNSEATVT